MSLQIVEHGLRQPARIARRLYHQGRHGGKDRGLGHATFAMTGDVVNDLAAASGMADVDGVLQVEMRRDSLKIVGIVVHVVSGPTLARASMATAIMGNDPKAAVKEEQHLRIPVVGRQRPTMAEDDGLSRTPVFVEYFGTVFGGDRGHREPPASLNCVDRAKNGTKGSAGASVLCYLRAEFGQLLASCMCR